MSTQFKKYITQPTASISITPSTEAQEIDVVEKAIANVAAMPTGTLGIVSATKGTVSNNSILVTPSVATGTAGYNAMAAYSGDAVTVSASELVSGTTNITTMNPTNVTNSQYAQIVDSNLVASNIKNGLSILGITGSYSQIDIVTSVPTTKTTDIIYNNTDKSYYIWKTVSLLNTSWQLSLNAERSTTSTLYNVSGTTSSDEIPTFSHFRAPLWKPTTTKDIGFYVCSEITPSETQIVSYKGLALYNTYSPIQYRTTYLYQSATSGSWYSSCWSDNAQTITFTAGSDLTNNILITWLHANATCLQDNGEYIKLMELPTENITIIPKVTSQNVDVTNYATSTISSIYEDISTSSEMDSNLTSANIGKMYRFTGTTDANYVNGSLYIVAYDDDLYYLCFIKQETASGYLCFTANTAGSTVSATITGTLEFTPTLEYSTDKTNWSTFTVGSTSITLANAGDKVYLRGDNEAFNEDTDNYITFALTGSVSASGNIMSLLDKTCSSLVINKYACFYRTFYNCTSLTTPPLLPATTLYDSCYLDMFYDCTNLTTAPALPAMTLQAYCYCDMFVGCSSLTIPPALPATTLAEACYSYMFDGAGLTTAPELSATTLATKCYNGMFEYTSITKVPNLPATTLATDCYRKMFKGCDSLYVSDSAISGMAEQAWYIPESGTATGDYTMEDMFTNCLGTRSTDAPNFNGVQKTYYTQNTPV